MIPLPPLPFPHLHNRKVKLSNVSLPKVTATVPNFAAQAAYKYVTTVVGGVGKVVNAILTAVSLLMGGKPLASLGTIVTALVPHVCGDQ